MNIALVHDFLAQDGGAERVLRALAEIYPEAPIYVWFYEPDRVDPFFKTRDVRTSFIQRLPLGKQRYQWYLPLLPTATDSFDLSDYDIVLSSSSSFIKGVMTRPETLHICYCHTPPRYLWTDTHDYVRHLKRNFLIKKILPFFLTFLRNYDVLSSQRVDRFLSNSHNVARRIQKYYRRESAVIYPPVDTDKAFIASPLGNFFAAGGRLMAYKRFDLIVQACNKLNLPLKIYGSGQEEGKLRSMAKGNIQFLGKISDQQKYEMLSRCLAFIHPQEEDLGITPIEAMACGRPVIAYAAGGVLETVIEGKTGMFFHHQTWESLSETLLQFDPAAFQPEKIAEYAQQFSCERFKENIKTFVEREWQQFRSSYKHFVIQDMYEHRH